MEQNPKTLLAKFKPTPLAFDFQTLDPCLREALPLFVEAFARIDDLYFLQQDERFDNWRATFARKNTVESAAFYIFKGPWNPLSGHEPWLDGFKKRPDGCAFYPSDLSKEEFETYLAKHEPERDRLLDPYTVVRRKDGKLIPCPYHSYYNRQVTAIADLFDRARAIIRHKGLKDYLTLKAAAFLNDDYRGADEAWVLLKDTPLEVVVGPYEVYDDHFMGMKASYEGVLAAVNREAGDKLRTVENNLPAFVASIPCPAGSKPAVGGSAPIVVADELLTSGDGYAGILASAFNLPNDPHVRGKVGWKQVMLKNVMAAKFKTSSAPIGEKVLGDGLKSDFEAYFIFVLLHEIAHGLGPAYRVDGKTVNQAMGSNYTAFEEAKADISSLHLLLSQGGRYGLPSFDRRTLMATFVAGFFRSIRFGVHEAHGKANLIQYSWLRERGVIKYTDNGKIQLDLNQSTQAVAELLDRITFLQAAGSSEEVTAFLDRYAKIDQQLSDTLASIEDIPIDIIPIYPIFDFLGLPSPIDPAILICIQDDTMI